MKIIPIWPTKKRKGQKNLPFSTLNNFHQFFYPLINEFFLSSNIKYFRSLVKQFLWFNICRKHGN